MSNPIDNLMRLTGNNNSYDESFRENMEYFIPYFLNHPDTARVDVPPAMAKRFEADFYGLLLALGTIPEEMHWFIMRLTGLKAPTEYNSDITQVVIPDTTTYQLISRIYYSNKRR